MNRAENNSECCPRLEPEKWDNKIHNWDGKMFVKGSVFTFFFMPLNFGSVMTKLTKKVEEVGGKSPDNLCLSEHTSKWKTNLFLETRKEIPETESVKMVGRYLSKVYEGSFNKTGEWQKDFEEYAKKEGLKLSKTYMWYTTCPKCAKEYGKNYVVIFGEIIS